MISNEKRDKNKNSNEHFKMRETKPNPFLRIIQSITIVRNVSIENEQL